MFLKIFLLFVVGGIFYFFTKFIVETSEMITEERRKQHEEKWKDKSC